MSHEQLISRSHNELAEVVRMFHELNDCYRNQFTIYMDSDSWELFDMRTASVIIRHEFKHMITFAKDMRQLARDIVNVVCVNMSLGRGRKPTLSEVWSIKRIARIYGADDTYFFDNPNIKHYIKYGNGQED